MSSSVSALSEPAHTPVPACLPALFQLEALADPGMLPRIVHEFAKRDIIPRALHVRRTETLLEVSISSDDMAPEMAELVAKKLRVIPWVQAVRLNGNGP
jgi:hypothetical protein